MITKRGAIQKCIDEKIEINYIYNSEHGEIPIVKDPSMKEGSFIMVNNKRYYPEEDE